MSTLPGDASFFKAGIVLAGFIIITCGHIDNSSLFNFVNGIERTMGFTRGYTALAFTLLSFGALAGGLIAGPIVDRKGVRKPMLFGISMIGAVLFC